MADTFAYHVTVHAREGKAGMTPVVPFALGFHHAMSWHLHYLRAFGAAVSLTDVANNRGVGASAAFDVARAFALRGMLVNP